LAITPVVIANFVVSGVGIPFAEEFVFGSILTSSGAEDMGMVLSVLFTSLTFSLFHWAITGAALAALIMLAIFRIIASALILWRRNLIIGLTMHMAVNIVGIWAIMVAGGVA